MPSSEDIVRLCFTISEVPNAFDRDAVTSLVRKKRSSATVTKLETVPGGEADDRLSRWIVCLKSENDVEYFYTNLKEEEIEIADGQWCTVKYLQTTECEIPSGWLEDMDDDDLESDGDPPPVPPEKPKKPAGHHPPYPSLDFAQSGFYHNIPTSMPGQPGPGAPQHSQGVGGGQGPPSGFQQPFFYPHMGPRPSMPQGAHGQQGPQGSGQQPPYMPQYPMMYNQQENRWVPVPPQYLPPHMSPGSPNFPNPGQGSDATGNQSPGFATGHGNQDRGSPPPYNSGDMGSDNTPSYNSGTNVNQPNPGQSRAVKDQVDYMEKLQHKINQEKQAKDTEEEPQEEAGPPTKIRVTNLPDMVDEDFVEMFFESKKLGGRTVATIELDSDKNEAIIEFEEHEAVEIVLQKLPVKCKGKILKIEVYAPESPSDNTKKEEETEEELPTKILVSDIPPSKADEDYLTMFFENKKKYGGGEVTNVELNEEEGVAIIEFEDPEAVQIVLEKQSKQPILLANTEIRVEAYVPEKVRDVAEDLIGGEGDTVKIVVTNIPEKAMEEEYLEMFFEKKGDIESVELYEEYAAAVVEFKDPEGVEKVLSKQPVKMYKVEVEVKPLNPVYVPRETVEVRGEGLDEDMLGMYFENEKRSKGGPIENLDLNEEEGVAYITFENETVARRVVDKGHHAVSKKQLSVSLHEPPDPLLEFLKQTSGATDDTPDQSDGPGDKQAKGKGKKSDPEPEQTTSRTIKVRGMKKVKSKETVQYYFENSRRSGGGEIAEMKSDEEDDNVAFISFESAEAAKKVSERPSHRVDNCELSVILYIPPPPRPIYEEKLLIKGIKSTTTKDCLFNFLEAKGGGVIPESQQLGEKDTIRLVTFQAPIDFDKLKQNAHTLEGASLQLEQVNVSNILYVANYEESMGKDTLELYFESERSGGGQVEKVMCIEDEGYWLVYFADYQVIDNVLHREHKLGQNKLVVKLFVDCLGRPQGGEGESRFKIPDPVFVPDPNTQKIKFILNSKTSKDAIENQMSSCHTKVHWPKTDAKPPLQIKLECTLTPKTKNWYKLSKEWKKNSLDNFQDYMKTIVMMQNSVKKDLWSDVVKTLQEITIDNPEAVAVFVEKEQGNVTIVGVKRPAEHLSDDIKQRIKKINEAADLAKQRTKETLNNIHLIDTKMLLAIKYPTQMEEKYKDFKVKINQNKNEIAFEGLGKDIHAAKLDMYEMKDKFAKSTFKDIPPQSLVMYQLKQVKEYIVKTLKQRNVPAVWDVKDNELVVCSASQETLGPSIEFIRDAVKENSLPLSKASRSIVNTNEWDSMVQNLQALHPGKVMISVADMSQVVISSTDDVEQEALKAVKKFLNDKAILDENVQLSASVSKLLSQHHRAEVDVIAKSLVSDHVQIIWNQNGFNIRGNEKGVADAKIQLQQLASKIISKEHTIDKPGSGQYFSQQAGRDSIRTVETQLQCVVRLKGEDDEDSGPFLSEAASGGDGDYGTGSALPPGMRLHASCVTPDDRKIFTVEGDMTEMRVDALVNTADKKLSLVGGLGKVIVTKGGRAVRDACARYIGEYGTLEEGSVFSSPGGDLNAGSVIHVVGPAWQNGDSNEKARLKEAVSKVMKQATLKNVSSIAIPAISCGTFGFPSKVATSVIVQAVQNYFREDQDCPIKLVYLCDVKQDTIEGFTEALKSCFGRVKMSPVKARRSQSPQQGARPKAKPRTGAKPRMGVPVLPTGAPPSSKPQGAKAIIGNITVTIVKGELAKEKVNAIVNTTADNLDLTNGAVSKSLLTAAGQEIQNEVKANHPDKLKFGETVVTKGYNLSCDIVIHTALPNYDKGPSIQILQSVMDKCLTEASNQNFTKVAFPAIGTGNLKFPKDVVAKEMFKAVETFDNKSPNSTISEVKFVVYHKDTSTVKAFEAEEVKWLSGKRVVAERQGRDFNTYQSHQEVTNTGSGSDSGTDYEVVDEEFDDDVQDSGSQDRPFGDINVVVKSGDITREACDCIVNSSNEDLDLSRGGVSNAILKKGGKTLMDQLSKKRHKMRKDRITRTDAPGLQCSYIMHIVAEDSVGGWKKVTTKCLHYAEKKQMRCIAFPALGTGISMKASDIAEVMVEALVEFKATRPKHVKEVRFVIFQRDMEQDFKRAVDNARSGKPGYLQQAWDGVKGTFGYGAKPKATGGRGRKPSRRHPTNSNSVTFTIYAMTQRTFEQAVEKLESILQKAVLKKEFTDSTIKNLDKNQVSEVQAIAKQFNVHLKMDGKRGFIEISGIAENIFDVTDKIHGVLRAADVIEHQRKEAHLIANITQWYFMEITAVDTVLTKYDPTSNHKIEKAFESKQPTVELVDADNVVYVVDFSKMEEYPKNNPGDTVQVIRRNLLEEGSFEPPPTWSKMGDTENLKVVTLQPTDQEYLDMSQKFLTSAGTPFTITKIERVQNKTLWQQYKAKKKQLEQQNPPNTQNERHLWHGFAVEAMDSINAHGFNRSYCGKNATAFGDGVYFAVNASYSTSDTYSRPDPGGLKRMYYCHVLTGECTLGKHGMRVPPAKPSSTNVALYDSVVNNVLNPNMFIIFNDTQAYPEYTITFKIV